MRISASHERQRSEEFDAVVDMPLEREPQATFGEWQVFCMCMCVCVFVSVNEGLCVCMCVRAFACVCVCVHVCVYMCVYAFCVSVQRHPLRVYL